MGSYRCWALEDLRNVWKNWVLVVRVSSCLSFLLGRSSSADSNRGRTMHYGLPLSRAMQSTRTTYANSMPRWGIYAFCHMPCSTPNRLSMQVVRDSSSTS
jgi:hypothetical protein